MCEIDKAVVDQLQACKFLSLTARKITEGRKMPWGSSSRHGSVDGMKKSGSVDVSRKTNHSPDDMAIASGESSEG